MYIRSITYYVCALWKINKYSFFLSFFPPLLLFTLPFPSLSLLPSSIHCTPPFLLLLIHSILPLNLSIHSPPTLLYPLFYYSFATPSLGFLHPFPCPPFPHLISPFPPEPFLSCTPPPPSPALPFTIPSPNSLMYPLFCYSFSPPFTANQCTSLSHPFPLSLLNFLCMLSRPLPFHSLYPFLLPFIFFYITPSPFPCITLLHSFSPFPPKPLFLCTSSPHLPTPFLYIFFSIQSFSSPSYSLPFYNPYVLFPPPLWVSSPSLCSAPAQVIFTLFTLLLPLFYLRRYIFTYPSSSFPFTYPSPLFTPFLYTLFYPLLLFLPLNLSQFEEYCRLRKSWESAPAPPAGC
jgi:hypothetical protein